MVGKADCGIKVILPNNDLRSSLDNSVSKMQAGDYVASNITAVNSQTLTGEPLYRTTLASY